MSDIGKRDEPRKARSPVAAIYLRVSSPGQESEGTSLASQEERCRAYAAEHGYQVAATYREVHTGTELWERPQLTAMREATRHRQFDIIVAYAIDRLARDPVHLGVVLSEADHAGVEVAFVSEPLDDSDEGQLVRFVRGYAAKIEASKIKERSVRGRRTRVELGKPLAGYKALYGYRWREPGKEGYDINPAEAAVVRRVFADAVGGKTLYRIARELEGEGIPSPTGLRIWRISALADILHHTSYAGDAFAFKTRAFRQNGTMRSTQRDPAEWVALPEGTVPAIVDAVTWEAAQGVLREHKHMSGKVIHTDSHLLRGGFAICGYCGKAMHTGWTGRGKPLYECPHSQAKGGTCPSGTILAGKLDPIVWARVRDVLMRPEVIGSEVEKLRRSDPTQADVAAIDRALLEANRKQARLVDALADLDGDAAEAVKMKLTAISAQKQQLQRDRDGCLERRRGWELAQAKLDDLQRWCRQVASTLEGFTFEQKQLALRALGVRAFVYRRGHEPRYEIRANIPLENVSLYNSICEDR